VRGTVLHAVLYGVVFPGLDVPRDAAYHGHHPILLSARFSRLLVYKAFGRFSDRASFSP